jgi:hypothetical protein
MAGRPSPSLEASSHYLLEFVLLEVHLSQLEALLQVLVLQSLVMQEVL